ncbi:hypothetical protein O9993_03005 [Vibrio lentus]|nr:hypothetical protein [Vibrio lentus]
MLERTSSSVLKRTIILRKHLEKTRPTLCVELQHQPVVSQAGVFV